MAFIRSIGNSTEVDEILNRDFTSFIRTGYVEVGNDNVCLPIYYKDFEERIRKFQIRDEDVYIFGHPKTGTTWVQEMVWLIVNDLDYETAYRYKVSERSQQLEYPTLFNITEMYKNDMGLTEALLWEITDKIGSPRVIKSHLHWSLLPEAIRNDTKQPKIIVTLRNPEDTCVSLYYHSQSSEGYKGTFDDFCKLFLAGTICFGPFWKQVLSFWNERRRPNIYFIHYKTMVRDLPGTIKSIAEFLEKPLTKEEVSKLANHLSFDSMKNNSSVNNYQAKELLKKLDLCMSDANFMRSGKVGEYKVEMSPEIVDKFKAWTEKNTKDTDLIL